jgi:hypothetical protein
MMMDIKKDIVMVSMDLNEILTELYFWYTIQSITICITIYATFKKYSKNK